MILYLIQAHHKPRQISELIGLLDDGSNRFVINIDPAATMSLPDLDAIIDDAIRPRVAIRLGLPVTWGGISQVHAWLDAYSFAVNHVGGWEYLVTLSGSCVPLVRQSVIKTCLQQRSEIGERVHVGWWHWEARGDMFYTSPIGRRRPADMRAETISLNPGVGTTIQAGLRPIFDDGQTSPIHHAHLRGAIHCTDLTLSKNLVIRDLLPFEMTVRRQKMQKLPVKGGWLWCILRRDAVEDILVDPILPDVIDLLQNFICPDELFLHTLLHNSMRFRREPIGRQSRHFRDGRPSTITDQDREEVMGSGRFFARKVDYDACPELMLQIRTMTAEQRFEPDMRPT